MFGFLNNGVKLLYQIPLGLTALTGPRLGISASDTFLCINLSHLLTLLTMTSAQAGLRWDL